jgi:hypothetical protein
MILPLVTGFSRSTSNVQIVSAAAGNSVATIFQKNLVTQIKDV